ncbi:hypothetical protein [Streptomyces sp. NBC_01304]|uniref:hypothetical protein n=1 Tax=Streptomyces sp. NBC_01304 TaxID=2903818 RepID=UPI002E0E192C|nr:hypothetical protein OG430_14155 [Streptomyces sp. NBC_01304]
MYDTSIHPYEIRRTNPDYCRSTARSLERVADQLPHSVAQGQGEFISDTIDAALTHVTWELGCIVGDLVSSFNGKGDDHLMLATAIRQCAAPLGLAQLHLTQAMDQISAHHQIFAPTTNPQVKAPKVLLSALQQDIDHARTAICTAANQFKINASLLDSGPIAAAPTPN